MMLSEPHLSWMPTRGCRDPFTRWQTDVKLNRAIDADQPVPDIPHADVVLIFALLAIYL